jgi:hypothetical protein
MEISCRSADAVLKIMGPTSRCTKRGMGNFEIFEHLGGWSLEALLDTGPHNLRRQVWDRAQNSQGAEDGISMALTVRGLTNGTAMAVYETQTRSVVRTWLGRLESHEKAPIETTQAMLLLAFDNMGKIGFSKDFGTILAGKGTRWLDLLHVSFTQVAKLGNVRWPILILKSLGQSADVLEFQDLIEDMAEERLKVSGCPPQHVLADTDRARQ